MKTAPEEFLRPMMGILWKVGRSALAADFNHTKK
jgi:hypothetical protein